MTDKQAVFCQEYMVDMNATQAAVRAGYSPKSSSRLKRRPEVRDEIERLMDARSVRTGIAADRVLRELARIAFVNPVEALRGDDDISEECAAAIADMKIRRITTKDGSRVERDIKLHDKVKALELLGKHLGMFGDRVKIDGVVPVVIAGGDQLED